VVNRHTYKCIHERHRQLRKLTDSLIITAKIPREISSDTARHVIRFFLADALHDVDGLLQRDGQRGGGMKFGGHHEIGKFSGRLNAYKPIGRQ